MRMITSSDLRYFDFHTTQSRSHKQKSKQVRHELIILLKHFAKGGFNKIGNLTEKLNMDDHPVFPSRRSSTLEVGKFSSQVGTPIFGNTIDAISPGPSLKNVSNIIQSQVLGDNISDLLSEVIEPLRLAVEESKDFAVSLASESVPLLLITLVDYMTDLMLPRFVENSCGINFSIFPQQRQILEDTTKDVYSLLLAICNDNNLAKAQIFKGVGQFHLINLLKRKDIGTAIFI